MYDARSMTQREAELNQRIIDEIVDPEVVGPMEKIGWQHGTPPPPEVTPEGQPAQVTTEGQPNQKTEEPAKVDNPSTVPAGTEATTTPTEEVIDWDALKDPNGKYAGKYNSKQELIKGMSNVVAMAKQAFSERDAERMRRLELENRQPSQPVTQPAPVLQTPVEIPTGRLDTVLAKIAENGGLLDESSISDLKTAIAEHALETARRVAAETVEARDARVTEENNRWNKVDAFMRENYPESVNFTNELSLYIQSNPVISAGVDSLVKSGRELDATVFAWKEFAKTQQLTSATEKIAQVEKAEVQLTAAEQVRKEAVDQARKDAGVVTTTAGGVHEKIEQNSSPDEIEMAAAEMRRTGDTPGTPGGARWRQLTIMRELDNDPLARSIFG